MYFVPSATYTFRVRSRSGTYSDIVESSDDLFRGLAPAFFDAPFWRHCGRSADIRDTAALATLHGVECASGELTLNAGEWI